MILWGALLEVALVLLIDYTAIGNLVFGTAPIGGKVWLFMLPFAVGMLILEELRKRRVRARYAKRRKNQPFTSSLAAR